MNNMENEKWNAYLKSTASVVLQRHMEGLDELRAMVRPNAHRWGVLAAMRQEMQQELNAREEVEAIDQRCAPSPASSCPSQADPDSSS